MELSVSAVRKNQTTGANKQLSNQKFMENPTPKLCKPRDLFCSRVFKKITTKLSAHLYLRNRFTTRSLNSDQNGFATIFILLTIGLILSCLLAVAGLSWFMMEKQQLQKTCQVSLLKAQKKLIEGKHQLLALNPSVKLLVMQKKNLQKALAAAPTPYEKAAILAALVVVISKMTALKTKQQTIIRSAELIALSEVTKLRRKLHQQIRDIEANTGSPLPSPMVSLTRPKMKVQAIYKDPLLPEYKRVINYAHAQTLKANFSLITKNFFPEWIQSLQLGRFNWQESCASHPEKGGLKWYAQIGEGKLFPNASSLF